MKYCKKCNQEKPKTEFHKSKKTPDGYFSWCKNCRKVYDKKRLPDYLPRKRELQLKIRARNTKNLHQYLKDKFCTDCGENRIPTLQFDHSRDKHANVSDMVGMCYGWQSILEEIKKCDIRCANCHAIKTAKEQGWYN